jgi:hypothetical protein
MQQRETLVRRLRFSLLVALLTGGAVVIMLLIHQWQLASDNLAVTESNHRLSEEHRRLLEASERALLSRAVAARAALVEQHLSEIESVALQVRAEAERLLSLPQDFLPRRPRTAAGRDGFFLDEDFASPRTRPAGLVESPRYGGPISFDEATVKLAPWAMAGEARTAALEDARRLARLSVLLGPMHRSRDDLLWSVVGTRRGAMLGFPGSGRFQDKPEYDVTQRPWFQGALALPDGGPAWTDPHVDAAGHGLLMTCVAALRRGAGPEGAVGIEIPVRPVQQMLLAFTESAGGGARAWLVREDGSVVIDTATPTQAGDWKQAPEPPRLSSIDPKLGKLHQDARAGRIPAGSAQELILDGKPRWVGFASIRKPAWMLIVETERPMLPSPASAKP